MGVAPFEDLEIDITDVQPSRGFRYLLVTMCISSKWVKAFPTRTEQKLDVAKVPLWGIKPRFGLPLTNP